MALGDNNNTNNNDRYQPTVYCPIKLKNSESEKDPSEMSFSYWKNLLKISISPMIQNDGAYPTFDHKNQGVVYMNQDRARIFYSEIELFLQNPDAYNNMGVPCGATGLISISNGKEFGVNSPIIVIRKINQETGCVESSYMYQFKTNYAAVRNFDENTQKFDSFLYENIEIFSFMDILKGFFTSMSYATAYTVINANQYNDSRYNTKLDLLMDKAGIERKHKASGGGQGSSYFNMNNAGNTNAATNSIQDSRHEQTTIEELENMIG